MHNRKFSLPNLSEFYTAPNDTKSGAKIVKGRYFEMENTRESSTSFVIVVLAFQTCCNSLILEFYLNKIF